MWMGKVVRVNSSSGPNSPPLLLQSKLLCSISLCYLLAVILLFLALRHSSSSTKCALFFFRSSSDRITINPDAHHFLFSYPHSYGQHKHALSTHRSSCSNPLFFSDYAEAYDSIRDFPLNSSAVLRYLQGAANSSDRQSFGGNFTTQKRFSYFDHHRDETVELPCGFFNQFPVSKSDRSAMEKCEGVVVVSAIFNDHDKIRQPKGLGAETLAITCFFMFVDDKTLKELIQRHKLISPGETQPKIIGVWRLVRVVDDQLYENPAMNGVIPKYLVHRLFPSSKFSIWIDAKLQLAVDPLLLLHALVVSKGVDIAISKHPFYVHTMEEAVATARWNKWWDVAALALQMETYCQNGLHPWSTNKLPYPTDVPDSALILRKHGVESNLFSCLMFNELEAFNPRDQLAFAFVRDQMKPQVKMNMFEVEVFEQVVLEYRHNLKKFASSPSQLQEKTTKTHHLLVINESSCINYLSEMWGESHD